MSEWDGVERRTQIKVCFLHRQIESKLDEILTKLADYNDSISKLQFSVDNGLKSSVCEIESHVKKMKEQVAVLENFGWFQTWVTQLRDNLFKNILKLSFIGILIWFVLNFGKEAIKKMIGG